MKKKFLTSLGIFLFFFEKKHYEDYRVFLRLSPSTEECKKIDKNFLIGFLLSMFFGALVGSGTMLLCIIAGMLLGWAGIIAVIIGLIAPILTWRYFNKLEAGLEEYVKRLPQT
jgi:hypothetical protein